MKKVFLSFLIILVSLSLAGCRKDSFHYSSEILEVSTIKELSKLVKPKIKRKSIFSGFVKYKNSVDLTPVPAESEGVFSQTNIQVEGVDEADIVKNDDRYIYYANYKGIFIMDTNIDNLYVFETKSFMPIELYHSDNYLVVFGYLNESILDDKANKVYQSNFTINILDIRDLNNISVKREFTFDKTSYVSSRKINDDFYFILKNPYLYDSEKKVALLPKYFDNLTGKKTLDISNVKVMGHQRSYSCHNLIISFNALSDIELNIESFIGNFKDIYASKDNLFIANTSQTLIRDVKVGQSNTSTDVYRFKIEDGKLMYKSLVNVPGLILNQFSMDEYNDNFRIVTTTYYEKSETWAYNFKLNDDAFELTSKIGEMGLDERVFSVRFENNYAYVVTFKQIDPLYIIDFSNPESLKVVSELKTPGLSDYLHKYNDELLIGVGRNINEKLIDLGVKISLFDVSNPDNIIESDIYYFDSSTYFNKNHKSIIVLKEYDLFALPINDNLFYIFKIDEVNKKIIFQDKIIHEYGYNMRGVIINNKIYTITETQMKVTNLFDYNEIIAYSL